MSEETVPVKKCPTSQRLEELTRSFEEEFGQEVHFIVRVPGRVNLIGEHVDYCGFPVLPMALQQDVLIAVSVDKQKTPPMLQLRNLNPKYVSFDCVLARPQNIHFDKKDGKPHWYNYVLCGVKGAMEYLEETSVKGMNIMVTGNIPPAAGLSSSSALVSASCLVYLHAHNGGQPVDKVGVAALCAASERYIGTQGGGMDQAIAFLAKRGAAQYITWDPLAATPVPLPDDAVFVVAHSMTEANKAATNDFNQRVIECRLATAILAKLNGITITSPTIKTLADVRKNLNKNLREMLNLVNKQLQEDCYSKSEVCDLLEINEMELNAKYLTENTTQLTHFKLRQRATHVFEEAIRVENFRAICLSAVKSDKELENGRKACVIRSLGELMRNSHSSLEELYECSHPNLNRLVEISDEAGAHARLTGAGWGGCIVALCSRSLIDDYLLSLRQKYYSQAENPHQLFFTTSPNDGAEIYV